MRRRGWTRETSVRGAAARRLRLCSSCALPIRPCAQLSPCLPLLLPLPLNSRPLLHARPVQRGGGAAGEAGRGAPHRRRGAARAGRVAGGAGQVRPLGRQLPQGVGGERARQPGDPARPVCRPGGRRQGGGGGGGGAGGQRARRLLRHRRVRAAAAGGQGVQPVAGARARRDCGVRRADRGAWALPERGGWARLWFGNGDRRPDRCWVSNCSLPPCSLLPPHLPALPSAGLPRGLQRLLGQGAAAQGAGPRG